MSKLGYRKREPVELPPEKPALLQQMVQYHRRELGYSTSDMARMLCLTEAEFVAMYGEKDSGASRRPNLRIV